MQDEITRTETTDPTYQSHAVYTPRVDVFEGEEGYLLVADLPGMSQDDVSVSLTRDELTVEGGNESLGRFYRRAFRVPENIAGDEVTANLTHGVLEVRMPKAPPAEPRTIEVRAG